MLINLRNALMAGKRWKNPYVTDGLVAMWDGEWNAGGGVHTTERVCKNLVSDNYHGTVGSGVEIGNNYFGFNGVRNINNSIQLGNSWFGKPEHLTCEVCLVSDGAGDQSQQCAFGGTEGGDSGISYFSNNIQCRGSYTSGAAATTRFDLGYSWLGTSQAQTLSLSIGAEGCFVCKNGVIVANKIGGTVDWTKTVRQCFIGCDAFNPTEYHLNGKVYSVRFYSRAFTTSEIAANYAIDRARFGLP